jgi:hypothetical protein
MRKKRKDWNLFGRPGLMMKVSNLEIPAERSHWERIGTYHTSPWMLAFKAGVRLMMERSTPVNLLWNYTISSEGMRGLYEKQRQHLILLRRQSLLYNFRLAN